MCIRDRPVTVTAEATAAVPVISEEMVFGNLASAIVPDEILDAFKFVTLEPLPFVANLLLRLFVIVVENEASSPIAAASSFSVFNAAGAPSTKLLTAVVTYAVVATLVELSDDDGVVAVTPVANEPFTDDNEAIVKLRLAKSTPSTVPDTVILPVTA